MNKAKAQVMHAKKRAIERFGLKLNHKSYGSLVSQIQNGKAQFIRRQSNRTSLFAIKCEGRILKAVYDSKRHKIVTFLSDAAPTPSDVKTKEDE